MAYQDDPTGADSLRDLVKRIRRLEAGSPLGNSSISKGSLRIASAEGLIVEGSAKVSGILKGTGQFLWDGIVTLTSTFTARGTTRFEGDTTQVGAHHVQGNQDITGTLAVKGTATIQNNVNVTGAGKIIAGLLEMGPNTGDGGAGITASSGNLSLMTNGIGEVRTNYLRIGVALSTIDLEVLGLLYAAAGITAKLSLKTGVASNVYVDSTGKFWRTN